MTVWDEDLTLEENFDNLDALIEAQEDEDQRGYLSFLRDALTVWPLPTADNPRPT
jgi:hypothetical protein